MPVKVKVGDVFLIPIDDERNAIGQLVSIVNKGGLFCVVYDLTSNSADINLDLLDTATIIMFAMTLDAKLWHKHWPIVGNKKNNLGSIPKPIFKIETLIGYKVEDLAGRTIRRASRNDKERLMYRTFVAPVRLEKAVKAYYNVGPWLADFDDFQPNYLDHK